MNNEIPQRPPLGKRGTFLPNLTTNFANFGISFVVGLWFTPYLIGNLGTATYGLIPLATTIASYMAIITISLNHSTARFLTVALERNDFTEANSIFNCSLFGSLAVTALLLPVAFTLSIFAEKIIAVPDGLELHARYLFAFAGGAFLLNTAFTAFGIPTFCRNRFDLRNLFSIVRNLARVGFVVLLFRYFDAQVWHVGLALLVATALEGAGFIWSWRFLTPVLKISIRQLKWATIKSLTATGGWVMLTQVGTIFFLGIDLLIVNRVLGPEPAGRYAVALQWSAMLRTIAGTIAGIFAPSIMAFYARDDIDGLVTYTSRAIKFVGLCLAFPIALLCGFSRPMLTVWLGEDFADLASLLVLLVAPLSLNLAVMPLFSLLLSVNAVRLPGLLTLYMGIGSGILAILLAGPMGWGLHGVAAASALTLTAKNLIFIPLYSARKIGRPGFVFYRAILPIFVATVALSLAAWFVSTRVALDSWLDLGIAGSLLSLVFGASAIAVLMSSEERALLFSMISGIFRRNTVK